MIIKVKITKEKDLIFKKEDNLEVNEYLFKLIDIYSAVYMKTSNFLTKSQKVFYIASIILEQKKVSFKSKEALEFFNKYLPLKNKSDISVYLSRIQKKGWYKKIGNDHLLPDVFKDLNKVTFHVHLNNETDELN